VGVPWSLDPAEEGAVAFVVVPPEVLVIGVPMPVVSPVRVRAVAPPDVEVASAEFPPLCAKASGPDSARTVAIASIFKFMVFSFVLTMSQ
jgi:hypothetical protein